jgi:hypothetical protein
VKIRSVRVVARARRKIAELEEALEGAEFFTAEHAALLAALPERIDRVNAGIGQLTAVIEPLLAPYEEQLAQAESMPGWGRRAAQDALAETGAASKVTLCRTPEPEPEPTRPANTQAA